MIRTSLVLLFAAVVTAAAQAPKVGLGPAVGFTANVSVPAGYETSGTPVRATLGIQGRYVLSENLFLRAGLGLRLEQAEFVWAPEQLTIPWQAPTAGLLDVVEAPPGSVRNVTSSVSTSAFEFTPQLVARIVPFSSDGSEDGLYAGLGMLLDVVNGFSETQDWEKVQLRPVDAPTKYTIDYDGSVGIGGIFSAGAQFSLGRSRLYIDVSYLTRSEGDEPSPYSWLPARGLRTGISLLFPL
jgi:hypothetical protein